MSRTRPAQLSVKDLWELFPLDGLGPLPRSRLIDAEALPPPYRGLLAHSRHMTTTLEKRHAGKVELQVLDRLHRGDVYARRILLTVAGSGAPALLGIMRIHLAAAPAAAREEILAETSPLGSVLIAHRVLRRIEPLAYLKIEPTAPMVELLRVPPLQPVYGRLATIHCGGVPAVDLLEVVAP